MTESIGNTIFDVIGESVVSDLDSAVKKEIALRVLLDEAEQQKRVKPRSDRWFALDNFPRAASIVRKSITDDITHYSNEIEGYDNPGISEEALKIFGMRRLFQEKGIHFLGEDEMRSLKNELTEKITDIQSYDYERLLQFYLNFQPRS